MDINIKNLSPEEFKIVFDCLSLSNVFDIKLIKTSLHKPFKKDTKSLQGWRLDKIPLSKIRDTYLERIFNWNKNSYIISFNNCLEKFFNINDIAQVINNEDMGYLHKALNIEKLLNKKKIQLFSYYVLKLYGFECNEELLLDLKVMHNFITEIETENHNRILELNDNLQQKKDTISEQQKQIKEYKKSTSNFKKELNENILKYNNLQSMDIEKSKLENEKYNNSLKELNNEIKQLKNLLNNKEQEINVLKNINTEKDEEIVCLGKIVEENNYLKYNLIVFLNKNNYEIKSNNLIESKTYFENNSYFDYDVITYWKKISDDIQEQLNKTIKKLKNNIINDDIIDSINFSILGIKQQYIILRNLKSLTLSYLSDAELEKDILS